ncbi:TetR/AcrR family transcriptional regulator [Paenirhodobacter sp.]|uniref:TetR/AcrR family transcriptional regulator n=1 Tax=Paenirhodobacter sp. TaxID=1965326 RepID=UPI003B3C2D98
MSQPRPVIRKGRKFDQVLEGARTVFLRDGFEGASVDDIAAAAGVSKATLYSYFPDKRLLFLEAAKSECARQADEAVNPIAATASAREMLRYVGGRIVDFISSDFGMAMFRIGVAEAQRFPEIGRDFYQSGPLLLRQRLGGHLRDYVNRGELAIEDIDLAADQFAELCKADIHARLILGVTEKVNPRDARRIIDGAVEMFLARYAVR